MVPRKRLAVVVRSVSLDNIRQPVRRLKCTDCIYYDRSAANFWNGRMPEIRNAVDAAGNVTKQEISSLRRVWKSSLSMVEADLG